MVDNPQGLVEGHEAFGHFLSVVELARTHQAMQVANVTQFYHGIRGMSHDGCLLSVQPPSSDAIDEVTHQVCVEPGSEDELLQMYKEQFNNWTAEDQANYEKWLKDPDSVKAEFRLRFRLKLRI